MAMAHQRPLSRRVLDEIAALEAVVRSRSCRPATGPDDAADLEVPGAEDR